MKWLLISSLLWILPVAAGFLPEHALYIAVISIEHEQGASTAMIQFKIFKDDLSDAVYNESARRHHIDQIESIGYQKDIKRYLKHHFNILINEEQVSFKPVSFEIQADAAFISCTSTVPEKWKKAEIQATILYELFPTQQNMIHFRDGKNKQFARLSLEKSRVVFE